MPRPTRGRRFRLVDEMARAKRHVKLGPYPTEWWDCELDRPVPPPHDVGRCWDWVGKTDEKGYGRYRYRGVLMQAHRAIWLLAGRALDAAKHLDHRCRRTCCVNPKHLQEVTPRENNRRARR